eukprot:GHVU01122721.1.p1 GENE.GHVU01122721.1~~GHVU01122721.1.p1  ORF type:complete len:179 (-),score=20.95 GHVU01122721.1:804-1340(-)
MTRFTASGNHDPDLGAIRGVEVDVLYLWRATRVKPALQSFIKGGFAEGTGRDSLDPTRNRKRKRGKESRQSMRAEAADKAGSAMDNLVDVLSGIAASTSAGSSAKEELETQEMLLRVESRIDALSALPQPEPLPGVPDENPVTKDLTYWRDRQTDLRKRLQTYARAPVGTSLADEETL